ncbi:MAG: patatin-like phospholipase family protein [Bacteroidales bacterium]|nr:patatin-like phospholipase family protein [Bacteroidales bacterium]MDD4360907.1 patatin-like phospholipase family protein [Bacteroidales bacterium]MDD4430778.1 patatin-like phospholipase family protein [Bacteroidales bacterium]
MSFKRRILFAVCLSLVFYTQAQRVGLVLSGGGAKGLAHVGLIQALEENQIPIDYVTGTSIGAIVGSLYAIGLSPDEMMAMFLSEDFTYWSTGTIQTDDIDYFRKGDQSPEFFSTYLSLSDSLLSNPGSLVLPSSLVNASQLNYAFVQVFSQYTALCRGDFNRLFIPFRCVAADVHSKQAIVFRKGRLEDAVRASMSFPMVFNAVSIDTMLLLDGGIYDNYPVELMQNDFGPDFIIGSNVSVVNSKPDENDVFSQIEHIIIQPNKFELSPDEFIQFKFELKDVSLMDFNKAMETYQKGYALGISMIDSIKNKIIRREHPDSLAQRRKAFKANVPELVFYELEVNGLNDQQEEYVRKMIGYDKGRRFTLKEFRKAYYALITDTRISQIIPKVTYNQDNEMFRLRLDIKTEENLVFALGGNISSTTSNLLYARIGYQRFGKVATYYSADAYVGSIHNALRLNTRWDMVGKIPSYLQASLSVSSFKFYEGEKLFYEELSPAFIQEREILFRLRYGLPAFDQAKFEIGYSVGRISDWYMQSYLSNITQANFDRSYYDLSNFSLRLEKNNLNHRQYPTGGSHYYLLGQYLLGKESYSYPDSVGNRFKEGENLGYFQAAAAYESYFNFNKNITLGCLINAVYNNKRSLDNYTASIIQAPAFKPTPYTMSTFNEAFRSNKYAALGLMPIWTIRPFLHLRSEFYSFMPLDAIKRGPNQQTMISRSLSNTQFLGEISLVFHQPFVSMSLFANYLSYPKNNWNAGINIGFLMFNKRLVE